MLLVPAAQVAHEVIATLPRGFWLFLGVAEVLAGVGRTLPGLTGIQPGLAVWAAGGVMFVMISATLFHLQRGEFSSAAITFVLLAMATYVAFERRIEVRG